MSARRSTGDRVYKQPGAGFVLEGCYVTLAGVTEACVLGCGDPDCLEWSDARTDDGLYAHHVSECETADDAPAGQPASR